MKSVVLTLVGCLFSIWLLAQSSALRIEPAELRKQVTVGSFEATYEESVKVTVTNTSGRPLSLRWDKQVAYQPIGWESQICDKVASYPPAVSTNYDPLLGIIAPVELQPGESFELYLNIFPFNISGQIQVAIPFREINRPDAILGTANFQISIFEESMIQSSRNGGGNRPSIFPNPVTDRFFIANAPPLSRVEVYNTLGRTVKTFEQPRDGDSFPIEDLPQGVYLVSLVDENGKVIRTVRLLRREFRP
ncbi:MAG: T9SS type A sorting domain-containing protein [Lewinella sp.]|nr:T9SS type A sorting domain-containing protein [Lewinella sp.]